MFNSCYIKVSFYQKGRTVSIGNNLQYFFRRCQLIKIKKLNFIKAMISI